jgi:hypothetical protein
MKQKSKPIWVGVVFVLFLIILLISLVKAFIEGSHFVIDSLIFIVIWILLFFYYQRLGIKEWVMPLIAFALFMSIAGLYNAYNLSFLGIGYDKYLHIATSFAVTIALFQIFMNRKHKSFYGSLALAFLVLGALSSFSEIGEFIGSVYLGVSQGFLAMGAGEAYYPVSDLVRYDTQWDMIFSIGGSLLAVVILSAKQVISRLRMNRRRRLKSFF